VPVRSVAKSDLRSPSEIGQASVELIAVAPFIVLVGLLAWQFAVAGHALWMAGNAARVAARAEAVGEDAERAARSALPDGLEEGLQVEPEPSGRVRVAIDLPVLVHGWHSPVAIEASAYLAKPR
jgi:pilus assembly protein CpaE